MGRQGWRRVRVVGGTFFLGFVFTLIPLPAAVNPARPLWLALLCLFWSLALPEAVSVGVAFLVGFLVDLTHGQLLGQYALAMTLITYFMSKFHVRIWLFSIWQQMAIVFLLSLLYQATVFWTGGLIGQAPQALWFWLPALTTPVLWPWLFMSLKGYTQRYALV